MGNLVSSYTIPSHTHTHIGYCCWLSNILDGTLLHSLRIPQSHNSATGEMIVSDRSTWDLANTRLEEELQGIHFQISVDRDTRIRTAGKWSKTQDLTLYEQLISGVRSFDIRVYVPRDGSEPYHHHGTVMMKSSTLVGTMRLFHKFLQDHSSEFINVILVFTTNGTGYQTNDEYTMSDRVRLNSIITNIQRAFVDRDGSHQYIMGNDSVAQMTLGEVRGKIIFYTDPIISHTEQIISYYETYENDTATETTVICRNWSDIEKLYIPCFPILGDEDLMHVQQIHTQVDKKTIQDYRYMGLRTLSIITNGHVIQWLYNRKPSDAMNIIEMDFFTPSFMDAFIHLNRHHSIDLII